MTKTLTGLATALFLFWSSPSVAQPNIFNQAASYIGLHERTHRNTLKTITKVDPARTPWCAAFLNGVLRQMGLPGTGSNRAISFAKYRKPTKSPKKGDIVVFRSHVGIFQGFTGNGKVAVLGGNQSNRVKVSHFSTRKVISYRTI